MTIFLLGVAGCGSGRTQTVQRGAFGTGGVREGGGLAESGGATGNGGNTVIGTNGDVDSEGAVGNRGMAGRGGTNGMGDVVANGESVGNEETVGTDGGVGRYVIKADGLTVTDRKTGLIWQRDGSGPRAGCTENADGTGKGNVMCTWFQAQAYCAGLFLDGSGWRLPTVAELESIVDRTVTHGRMIDPVAFPDMPATGAFWTSSLYAGSSGSAWCVFFGSGKSVAFDFDVSSRVRCAR